MLHEINAFLTGGNDSVSHVGESCRLRVYVHVSSRSVFTLSVTANDKNLRVFSYVRPDHLQFHVVSELPLRIMRGANEDAVHALESTLPIRLGLGHPHRVRDALHSTIRASVPWKRGRSTPHASLRLDCDLRDVEHLQNVLVNDGLLSVDPSDILDLLR